MSYYFYQFQPIFKEKRTPEKESQVVGNLLLSMGFEDEGGNFYI